MVWDILFPLLMTIHVCLCFLIINKYNALDVFNIQKIEVMHKLDKRNKIFKYDSIGEYYGMIMRIS